MEETLKSINYPQKQTLHPENQASKGMNIIYWFYKIVFVYLLIAVGVIIFLIGFSQGVVIGLLYSLYLIFVGFINLLLLQFIKSLIVRTKAAEYFIAHMEKEYNIKQY